MLELERGRLLVSCVEEGGVKKPQGTALLIFLNIVIVAFFSKAFPNPLAIAMCFTCCLMATLVIYFRMRKAYASVSWIKIYESVISINVGDEEVLIRPERIVKVRSGHTIPGGRSLFLSDGSWVPISLRASL